MSNRLTFSLASLFLIFALAFVALPVTAQTVESVVITSTPTARTTYAPGEEITVQVTFSETVDVAAATTGVTATDPKLPKIKLDIGGKDKYAVTAANTGQTTYNFTYTVVDKDEDTDGISIDADALSLGGGTIYKEGTTDTAATLDHSAVPDDLVHKVDGVKPKVSDVAFSTTGPYMKDDTIQVTVTFAEDVVINPSDGVPEIGLLVGFAPRQADYVSGSGTSRLIFRYTVEAMDTDTDGVTIVPNGLKLTNTGGDTAATSIDDLVGNAQTMFTSNVEQGAAATQAVDTTAPKVVEDAGQTKGIAITSTGPYMAGDDIEVTVTFKENVKVMGKPQVPLKIGATTKQAAYASGDGMSALVFKYTVTAGETDPDGVEIDKNTLALNNGTIKDTAGNVADLMHKAVAKAAANAVDTTVPMVSTVAFSTTGPYVAGNSIGVSVTFSESVMVNRDSGSPQIGIMIGSATKPASYFSSSAQQIQFLYTVMDGDNDADGVSIAKDALIFNGGTIKDTAGNAATLTHAAVAKAADQTVSTKPVVTALPQPTNVAVVLNAAKDGYTVSWNPPPNAAGIGGYYVSYNPVMFVPVGTNTLKIDTKPTSVSVWSTADPTAAAPPPTAPPAGVTPAIADSAALAALADLPDGGDTGTGGTAPGAPANFVAAAGTESATLTWTAVPGKTYEYKKGSDTTWMDATSPKTVTGLTPGTEYTFMVRVKADTATSTPAGSAATATATPDAQPDAPGPVTNLTATAGNGRVMLSWAAPTTGAVTGYEYSMNGGVSWMKIQGSSAATRSYTVTRLTNGQTYSFLVRAENATGPGNPSNTISATPTAPAAPAAPVSLTAAAGNGQVVLAWTASTDTTITKYQYSKDSGATWMDIPSSSSTTATYTVTGLINGTAYTFQVRAVNLSGGGTPSSASATPVAPAGTPVTMYDDVAKTTTLAGMIVAHGFVVIESADLPDIAEFFRVGGTIELMDPASGTATKWDVVISEILWGYDHSETNPKQQDKHQFIELYNTTTGSINLTGWMLKFNSSRTTPAIDVDQVSNVAGGGWIVDIGQNGRWTGTSNQATGNSALPTNIVSMYRNINYARVVKPDHNKDSATENRKEQLKDFPNGNAKGSWKASTRAQTTNGIYESKGRQHYPAGFAVREASPVAGKPFIINEIGNDTGSDNDWVELQNVSDSEQSLKNYQLTAVTAKGTDTELHDFHDKDWKVPAGRFVVISTRHPRNTDLAAGKDITIADDEEDNSGASHLFVVRPVNLPDDGKFALILRGGHGDAHKSEKTANHLIDVVATRTGAFKDDAIGTSIWPLKATGQPHEDVIKGGDEVFAAGKVYQRNGGNGRDKEQFEVRGYTGIGYDRAAADDTGANGGTPGYDNSAVKEKIAEVTTGEITISEIMADTGEARQNLAQWIELYNSSMTQSVNLNGWKLQLENAATNGELETNTFSATITLDAMTISPNQTVLIATTSGRVSDADHFPSSRVVNLWTTKKHRDALEMARRTDPVLSSTGFHLKLTDKDGNLVDEGGNLDGNRRTRDDIAWALPASEDDGRRSSMIRVYDNGVAVDGTIADGWVSADATNLAYAISHTFYGEADDFGTPGFRGGGPVPVSLSKFRPERLDDGTIVVRWITESELNNAGFNILRSDTRNGQFAQINTSLIKGQGTTSERTTYAFPDTSAKPNVVYYYQIQDVSLDGNVTTLRQSRLKGDISAAGKLTTTWGELKALQ